MMFGKEYTLYRANNANISSWKKGIYTEKKKKKIEEENHFYNSQLSLSQCSFTSQRGVASDFHGYPHPPFFLTFCVFDLF